MDIPTLNFDHSHHKLKIRGLKSPADVLTFTGHEQLSSPFRYDIEFTSTNKAITPDVLIHLKYEKNREDIGLFGIWRD
ncbi:TPA: type VI secretion system Vgr family domain protein [Escherichia coli]